jgi:hypothetical protein
MLEFTSTWTGMKAAHIRNMLRSLSHRWIRALLVLTICPIGAVAQDDPPWSRSPWFEEQSFTSTLQSNVRYHVNAPLDDAGEPAQGTRLIIYTLPNGNTIEQSLGCRMAEGLDWHYDIQHLAAQVRLLRSLRPQERIVLLCAEAEGLSWPTWRKTRPDANTTILQMVDQWRQQFGDDDAKVTLTGHSGGGSFMFGLIEAVDEIPAYIDRIAFLDANYSFDAALHAAKLERWLEDDDERRLIVLAYDDREITYDGKKVVGPDGGTFRATDRMREALGKTLHLKETINPPFQETTGLDGRIHFYVHSNRQNKILHTALVGDMNGFVHVQTLGTPHTKGWGTFGGPRAYTKWIQAEPTPNETEKTASTNRRETVANSQIPPRPAGAISGRAFIESLHGFSFDDREAAILREVTSGNVPEFLRDFKTVQIRGMIKDGQRKTDVTASLDVMPDYLAVGSNDDYVRMPMTPQTAQRIADRFGCVLPTRKIVDAIDAQAEVHLTPHPLSRARESVGTFLEHHDIVEKQRAGKPLDLLITGIKKDIVLSPRIFERPERLAIYGWRQLDGKPIQPLTIVHWNRYVDYSHGARLVRNNIDTGGKNEKITDLLADPDRCALVSDEGRMNPPRYPLDK